MSDTDVRPAGSRVRQVAVLLGVSLLSLVILAAVAGVAGLPLGQGEVLVLMVLSVLVGWVAMRRVATPTPA